MRKLLLLIPMMALMVRFDLWAEPSPEPVRASPAFEVQIMEHKAEECEIELEVESMEFDKGFDLLCRCIEAESGNQSFLGKRLCTDVVLNRVASPDFPDGIEGVINQANQFSVVSNGMIDQVIPTEETIEAVLTEMNEQIDTEILYFQAGGFSQFGEPAYRVDDHYFSK